MDGLYRRTLVAEQMDSPRAIALDPGAGLVFWSDWDQAAPRIERCSPAGRRRTALLRVDQLSGGAWPNGLALDHRPRRLYWIDARSVPPGTSCGPTRPRVTRPYLLYKHLSILSGPRRAVRKSAAYSNAMIFPRVPLLFLI